MYLPKSVKLSLPQSFQSFKECKGTNYYQTPTVYQIEPLTRYEYLPIFF